MRRRLANFLTMFPGHTAVNVHDIAYADWRALAAAVDERLRQSTARRRGR